MPRQLTEAFAVEVTGWSSHAIEKFDLVSNLKCTNNVQCLSCNRPSKRVVLDSGGAQPAGRGGRRLPPPRVKELGVAQLIERLAALSKTLRTPSNFADFIVKKLAG